MFHYISVHKTFFYHCKKFNSLLLLQRNYSSNDGCFLLLLVVIYSHWYLLN